MRYNLGFHTISMPRKIQENIGDEMRWIDLKPHDTCVATVSSRQGDLLISYTIAAMLPWNRNRRPKVK